jgi:hypothetical protein
MMAIPNATSSIIRLFLAVLVAVAVIGPAPGMAGNDWTAGGAHYVQGTSSHDCCDPEPAAPDGSCALACAQAPCGWTVFPAGAGWLAPIDHLPVQWKPASILTDDTAPETATPPPRA